MVRRVAALSLAVSLAACKGDLNTGKGNDFPCDFSQPEGQRDAVCSPGDVCGVDNLCRQYRYEGPQFELGANAPDFSTATLRHPLVLTEPVTFVTRSFEGSLTRGFVLTPTRFVRVEQDKTLTVKDTPLPLVRDLTAGAVCHGNDPYAVVLDRRGTDDFITRYRDPSLDAGMEFPQLPGLRNGDRLRTGFHRIGLVMRGNDAGVGAIGIPVSGMPERLDPQDGGFIPSLDVRFLPAVGTDEVLSLTAAGLYYQRQVMGPFQLISGSELMPAELLQPGARADLRMDLSSTIAAFTVFTQNASRVLSTWRIDRFMQASAVRLWSDCRPCRNGRIAGLVPVNELGNPIVEVLCEAEAGATLSVVRVTGSATADSSQLCIVEPIEVPFPLSQVNKVSRGRRASEGEPPFAVTDESTGVGVAVGGKRGQVWVGPSFSRAVPIFLERTPISFGELPPKDGVRIPAVLTDQYLAMVKDPAIGFEVLDIRNVGVDLPKDVTAAAFVAEAPGWGMLSSGDLIRVDPSATDGGTLTFGPRLLDNRNAPAHAPYFAEAVSERDGGLVSFVITADDSVYFVPAQGLATTSLSNMLMPVTPQLTPAPSAAVRSFALERSALGTDGRTRVRAYLVAGRSLFLVTLDGTPPRWAATPLVLQAGEPLEVWMDHPLGGLGRVGYRDGQVYTLPGGFLLVNELPRDAGSNPPQVLDYENLGGWPVAMTSNGLFEAHYDVLEGGKLDNRFPDGGINKAMAWKRVTLPDGGEPWLGKTSRLHVSQETLRYDGGFTVPGPPPESVRVFRLNVYTDEQVVEAGVLVRR